MKKTRLGMTLIEMMIALSVVALVLAAVLGIFNSSTRLWNAQAGRSKSLLTANLAMEMMAKDIGSAVSVQNDSNGSPTIFILPATMDASGNATPTLSNGTPAYAPGTQVQFYLSNAQGTAKSGTNLWRQTAPPPTQSGGLLGGLLSGLLGGSGTVSTPDQTWSLQPGGRIAKYPNVTALSFSTAGLPANTVQITLTVAVKEGGQTSSYTVKRNVYLANHN